LHFAQTNLVADTAGVAAVTDPNLVNPWGISASPSGPFWVSDNGTGLSTLYNSTGGIISLVVKIPGAGGALNGPVAGNVFNGTTEFALGTSGPAGFLFDTEDGVISGWNGGNAMVAVDRSSTGAVYKGLAIAPNGSSSSLYAANFNANKIEVYDGSFNLTGSFTDTTLPAGYAPFAVTNLNNLLYVAFAKQDSAKHDDTPGAGFGYVDVFNPNGTLVKHLISNGVLNAPWGMAIAPAGFGTIGGMLLVGNFGDGKINVFDPNTGAFKGALQTKTGAPRVIDGLWALIFGNGGSGGAKNTLYFTAGPNNESHGLLGSLSPAP
jgi:uncharacterized protein (TIGR03118 family)